MNDFLISGFIKAAALEKSAQTIKDDEACKLLSLYTAFARALYSLHQQNHWAAKDYGNHLLFQRLYEESQEIADSSAERTIGLCGTLEYEGSETVIVKRFAPKVKTIQGLLESSLGIENAFQKLSRKIYDHLKKENLLTLGLDDLIMSQSSIGESHIYLLQQAIKGMSILSVAEDLEEDEGQDGDD